MQNAIIVLYGFKILQEFVKRKTTYYKMHNIYNEVKAYVINFTCSRQRFSLLLIFLISKFMVVDLL